MDDDQRRNEVIRVARVIVFIVAGSIAVACSKNETPAPVAKHLREVTLPDLSRADATVQEQIKGRYAAVDEARTKGVGDANLSEAYGQLGMVLQAAEYYEAAEPPYL